MHWASGQLLAAVAKAVTAEVVGERAVRVVDQPTVRHLHGERVGAGECLGMAGGSGVSV
jgi:hypothetical protein